MKFLTLLFLVTFSLNSFSAVDKYFITKTIDSYEITPPDEDEFGPGVEYILRTDDPKKRAILFCDPLDLGDSDFLFYRNGIRTHKLPIASTDQCRDWASALLELNSSSNYACIVITTGDDESATRLDLELVKKASDCQ